MSYEELAAAESAPARRRPQSDADLWAVLENGIRDISGEVRNSLDFHRSQEGGGEVSHVVMSGCAQDIPGFAEALQASLGVEVRCEQVGLLDGRLGEPSPRTGWRSRPGSPPRRLRNEGRKPDPRRAAQRPARRRRALPGRRLRRARASSAAWR